MAFEMDIPKLVDQVIERLPVASASKKPLPALFVGREWTEYRLFSEHLDATHRGGFSFGVLPLHDPQHDYWLGTAISEKTDDVEDDPFLKVTSWCSYVYGALSPRTVSPPLLRSSPSSPTIVTYKDQIAWAAHLSLSAILLPPPPPSAPLATQYAQFVYQALLGTSYTQFWLEVPLADSPLQISAADLPPPPPPLAGDVMVVDEEARGEKKERDTLPPAPSPWHAWSRFRTMCDYHPQLHCALILTSDLPSENVLDVWMGEPVRAVIVPTSVFLTNAHGYPCLSPSHQQFIAKMMRLNVQFIIRGDDTEPAGASGDPYVQYLKYIQRRYINITDQIAFEEPYFDYLQTPLQPLMDNLESQTYETFEKDPIKYKLYEEAVYRALTERKATRPEAVLMVLGAGRGPLVVCSLRASERAGVPVRLFAVEKNPNAVVTLKHMSRTLGWEGRVEIIASDMRVWEAPVKADIIVSELLGSFSDNELSPECLDGAQKFLADDGVSVPCKYTSYIAPISAQKVWKEVRSWKEQKHFETAYVCKLHNFYQFAKSQPLFEFVHPNRAPVIDNTRYDVKTFYAEGSAVLDGLVGYFHSQLYGDVCMSIDPATFSDGMISWFPLFFPLRDPITVTAGDKIEVYFWRHVSTTKVWYEWCVAVNEVNVTTIHNPNGRSYWIGLNI